MQTLTVHAKDLECEVKEAKQAVRHEAALRDVLKESNRDLKVSSLSRLRNPLWAQTHNFRQEPIPLAESWRAASQIWRNAEKSVAASRRLSTHRLPSSPAARARWRNWETRRPVCRSESTTSSCGSSSTTKWYTVEKLHSTLIPHISGLCPLSHDLTAAGHCSRIH